MRYQFPVIEHIDQVRSAIQDYSEFIVADRGHMLVVNYNVNLENTFGDPTDPMSQIRRECRGLKFDAASGLIIARPYHKFFNVNERAETQTNNLDLNEPHQILDKLDGSMIHAVPVGREFRFCTKMGITDVSLPVEEFVVRNPRYYQLVRDMYELGTTAIFEWCSPKQRIVIDYGHDQLILTAIRNLVTGEYWTYDNLCAIGVEYNVPVVSQLAGTMSNMEHLITHTRDLMDVEGYVVRWADGHMTKIKADHYVLLHRTKDQVRLEKSVVELLVSERVDDVKPLLDNNDLNKLNQFENDFWCGVDQTASHLEEVYAQGNRYESRRDFAVEFVNQQPAHLRSLLFSMRNGEQARDLVVKSIASSTSSQSRIDAARWLWGNHSWNEQIYIGDN